MKFSTFIVIILIGAGGGWYAYHTPFGPRLSALVQDWLKGKPDPQHELDKMVGLLPRHLRAGEDVTEVATYIEKRDDPIVPIVGYLTFVGASRYEYAFTWDTDHWVFSQMISREMNHDMTLDPVGIEIMNTPEMTRFLYPYKYPAVHADITAQNPAAVAPAPAAVVVAPHTPTPQEKALEIARKYGSSQ